jgi:maltose alpha-D-glucosyltransferase/alpha-amylase
MNRKQPFFDEDPLWYRDAVIYELPVKSFADSNEDGIGDFLGLIGKLDYLVSLGVTAIWLLPFYPSPLKDDGYDIADYYGVHADYGSLQDFRHFLRAAHERGLRVISELVINHSSDQHPWFKAARRAVPGSPQRDYYVWSDSPERYREARIIFKDYETSNWAWDPLAGAYYWHRFYSGQPDLNYDSPLVQQEMFHLLDYWLEMGVDGLRLDAIPYLFEREGTNCENLPETHDFLKRLRRRVDGRFRDRMLLAEANQWPEDAIAYFGEGDECHVCYHFPVMPRLFMALTMEDRFPIVDIMDQTPAIPDGCQWAMFLRNHDELTLEMVTDEERDYMYRVYAQDPRARVNLGIRRRLAPLMGNDRRKIELLNILLFSLPGTPVLYYGDEIGMGDNYYLGDRNGVRTPMQWSPDRNAGFSRCNPQRLFLPVIIDAEYHYEAVNVENQERNPSSLLWWMKRLIAARKSLRSLSRGSLQFLFPDAPQVMALVRQQDGERLLAVANLSRFPQVAELDLSAHAGRAPREVFSRNLFPPIGSAPYRLTLGPYGYLWLLLEEVRQNVELASDGQLPGLSVQGGWQQSLLGEARSLLERKHLPAFLQRSRWYGAKSRELRLVKILDAIPLARQAQAPVLLILQTTYVDGGVEQYLLPVGYTTAPARVQEEHPQAIIAAMEVQQGNDGRTDGVLYDGLYHEEFPALLLSLFAGRKKPHNDHGELTAVSSPGFRADIREKAEKASGRVLKAEQSNSSIVYGAEYFLKLYRRFEEGLNPDPELVRYLSEVRGFSAIPSFLGTLEYRRPRGKALTLGLLQQYVPSQSDGWSLAQSTVSQYFERVLARHAEPPSAAALRPNAFQTDHRRIPELVTELVGTLMIEQTILLAKRTAEMHHCLAAATENPDFAPEPFTKLYQRSLYQSLRTNALRGLEVLSKNLRRIPDEYQEAVSALLAARQEFLAPVRAVLERPISGLKIRIHGDYHLGQVLFTGKDFVIIDFEGEPMRASTERRLKRSALRDIAGMMRSFHYAAYSELFKHAYLRPEDFATLEPYADFWQRSLSGLFLSCYLEQAAGAPFLPRTREEREILLRAFLVDKGIYEMLYELNSRPEWAVIPVQGIAEVLGDLTPQAG